MPSVELSKVKSKIMALSRKTLEAGCSEAEAMSAMTLMGKLLEQYNLTMNECDVRESKCVTVEIPIPSLRRTAMDSCVVGLGKLFHGRVWFSKGYAYKSRYSSYRAATPAKYCFFIQEHDKEALEYLFAIIWFALENSVVTYKKSAEYKALLDKKHVFRSFKIGMAERIGMRLNQMREEADLNYAASKGTGNSLIVLKGQLVEQEFNNLGVKLSKARHYKAGIKNFGAYYDGDKEGQKVNLNRPIENGAKISGYIGGAAA